jgi:HAD superfamily hydrolase (TIGR01509 family)
MVMNPSCAIFKDIRVVAFDCDGVMFDTRIANRHYYNRILEHLDRPSMTEEQFAFVHMHTVDNSLAHLFKDPADLQKAQEFRSRMGYRPFLPYMKIEPTLRDLLGSLRPRYRTAIATNRTNTMAPLLEAFHLEDDFDLVVCASDVALPKPHPDVLLKILSHFAVEPRQVIYIGDSKLDAEAAEAAGVIFVAYGHDGLDGACRIQRLAELSALLDGAPCTGHGPDSSKET